jgi:hypothetical protein
MAKKIAGETVVAEPKSREGTVYITSKYVYKTFGARTNPYDVMELYKTAEAAGVPVPDTCKFTADLVEGSETQSLSGIRMSKASGTFFQLSKGGGEAALINEINAITSKGLAQKALSGLESAAQLGVMDPQGFVNRNADPPICFIDVHFRTSPNFVAFENAIGAARILVARLA